MSPPVAPGGTALARTAPGPTALERLFYPAQPEGWGRRALLSPLTALAWGFGAGVRARDWLYTRGLLPAQRVEGLHVVSVGNLHVGGSGKTPAVIFLAGRLLAAGRRVGVLTRGHGRRSHEELVLRGPGAPGGVGVEQAGDEPLLISRRCPGAVVLVGADRRRLARRARDELGLDTVLLDDGFQHRRLARDEDIVVLDEAVGLGNGRLLPRGPLREPPSALRRATLLWVRASSAQAPGAALPGPALPVVRVCYGAQSLLDPAGGAHPLGALEGQPVLALAGLAQPAGFLRTLRGLGAEVRGAALFADHHLYRAGELRRVEAQARAQQARIVTTEKDAVRLPPGFEAWTVRLGVEVLEGEEHLRRALRLAPARSGL